MPNTDTKGNKIAQKTVPKKVRSANLRAQRKTRDNHCDVCGYRKRSENHQAGVHHKRAEKKGQQ